MDADPLVKAELSILPLVVAGRGWRLELIELFVTTSGSCTSAVVVSK